MQAIFPVKLVGMAVTVRLLKEKNSDSYVLSGMLQGN